MPQALAHSRPRAPFGIPPESTVWPVLLAVAVALAAGANTLLNGFAYDDLPIIVNNPAVTQAGHAAEAWTQDYWAHARGYDAGRDLLYRPLTVYSYRLNHAVGGLQPFGYHLVNVGLHVAVAGLVVLVSRRAGGSARASALVGAVFAAMPIHTEAVANVVGRAELLVALFTLSAVLLAIRMSTGAVSGGTVKRSPGEAETELVRARSPATSDPPPGWHGSGALRNEALQTREQARTAASPATTALRSAALVAMILAALLSKESGIAAVVLAPLFALAAGWQGSGTPPNAALLARAKIAPGAFVWTAALAAVALSIYLPLRYHALGGRLVQATVPSPIANALVDAPAAERFWSAWQLLGLYVAKTFWPQTLCMDYSYAALQPASSPLRLHVWIGGLSVVALLAFGGLMWRRGRRVLAACAVAVLLAYLPVSNTVFLLKTLFAERVWYLPSALMAVVLGIAVDGWLTSPRRLKLGHWVVLIVVLAGLARSGVRNAEWRDNWALFTSAYRVHPTSAPILFALGDLRARARAPGGIALLERCVQLAPGLFDAQLALGRAYLAAGDADRAVAPLQAAAMQHAAHPDVQRLLAEAARRVADSRRDELDTLHTRFAQSATLPDLLAWTDALGQAGRNADALAALTGAADRFGDQPAFHRAHAAALMQAGQADAALAAYRTCLELNPAQPNVLVELATALLDRHQPTDVPEAARLIDRAVALAPSNPQVLIAHAELLAMQGDRRDAVATYRRLLKSLPPGALRSIVEARLTALEKP
jgi:protein O-mannosyl-transferase